MLVVEMHKGAREVGHEVGGSSIFCRLTMSYFHCSAERSSSSAALNVAQRYSRYFSRCIDIERALNPYYHLLQWIFGGLL